MHQYSIAELVRELSNKTFSSVELTQALLSRVQQHDEALNSFITVCKDTALAQAQHADDLRARGQAQALTGVPIAHKDIYCTAGIKTSCGSKMLDNFISPYNATIVERCQQAGMVLLGKTNLDEFAMGSSNENSYYGPVRNPWDTNKVPGGSSGGSAAAVAARLVPAATGTDTGGSIRQPAAFCGISGLKPTYGRLSRYGMIAYASSLDQGGPMARSAEDLALLLNVMAGFDPKDSTSVERAVPDYTTALNTPLNGLRIGLPDAYFTADLDPGIHKLLDQAIRELTRQGATVKPITLPHAHLALPTYYVIAPAEASSNLARYDGVRYGYRCEHPQDLLDLYQRSRGEGFGNEVKRRIMTGTYTLSAGYYDAYYVKAQKVRRRISDDFATAFKDVDVIASPTAPTTAFGLGEKTQDPISMYLMDIYTLAVNLAGLPALSMPVGFQQQLPVGMQLIGNYFDEAKLLNIAHRYQQTTHWHQRIPDAFQ